MDILDQVAQVVPLKYQVAFTITGLISKWLAEFYSATVAGGGIKRVVSRFIYGENIPKVIAQDYKAELNTTKPSEPTAPPTP